MDLPPANTTMVSSSGCNSRRATRCTDSGVTASSIAVQAARRLAPAQSGLVNAVLRRFGREREALLAQALQQAEARHEHPAWWVRRLQRDWPAMRRRIPLLLMLALTGKLLIKDKLTRSGPEAFAKLGDLSLGVMPVTWHYASCDYGGPIQYKFKEGSNQWWTAVQIRHHENRIAKFEYEKDGAWVEVSRTDYNYFVEAAGMGPGPYHFRVTDIFGQTLEDSGIPFTEGGVVDGTGQFPTCAE